MRILAIETSCDETAAAIVSFTEVPKGVRVTVEQEALHSQAAAHAPYGGVYPTLAKREHEQILPLLLHSLVSRTTTVCTASSPEHMPDGVSDRIHTLFADSEPEQPDAIAVTYGPGLAPALWVGVNAAHALRALWNVPLIGVNHMEGHICSALLDEAGVYHTPTYPLLALLVSGGHTELVLSEKKGVYTKIGMTLDDAAGEAFDKVARLLGLPYPGGPEISRLADLARKKNIAPAAQFPRPMLKDGTLNFSYAGLKTAVRVFLEKHPATGTEEKTAVAVAFEDAVVETLVEKTHRAIEQYRPRTVVLGGGVSANTRLREQMKKHMAQYSEIQLYLSHQRYATDNAVMIALAAYLHRHEKSPENLAADANLSFPIVSQ